MFRASVVSESNPVTIKRYPDGHILGPCYMSSNGASNWAPTAGDIVLCEEIDGFVYILFRVDLQEANAQQGVQLGDAQKGNGVSVSDDGLLTSIRSETNTVIVDEKGVHLNVTEGFDIAGSGYTFAVPGADRNATSLSTRITETLKAPLPAGGGSYQFDLEITQGGIVTMTTTIKAPTGATTAYNQVIRSDGTMEVTCNNAAGVPIHSDVIDATGNRVIYGLTGTVTIGGPVGVPLALGGASAAVIGSILTALTAHANNPAAHPVADAALAGACGTIAGTLPTMNTAKLLGV